MPARDMYDPTFSESQEGIQAWADLVAIVRHLRRDCPWDREQTHESVKHLLVEEAFEVVDTIDRDRLGDLPGELGDLLLHVLFHSAIAEGTDSFQLADVIKSITDKLIRRHPHVFDDVEVDGVSEVLANWEKIKLREGDRRSVLDGVPLALPSLLRAHRIQEKVAGVGFDFADASVSWTKVEEEIREFRALGGRPAHEREAELGDLLFSLVNYARLSGLNAENALRSACNRFDDRFRFVESEVDRRGSTLEAATLEEMDADWDEAKRHEAERNEAERNEAERNEAERNEAKHVR
jgi:XTP/dITP diphosphohydrolase/tetrapyrrole methylase family protein/MazG family protein